MDLATGLIEKAVNGAVRAHKWANANTWRPGETADPLRVI